MIAVSKLMSHPSRLFRFACCALLLMAPALAEVTLPALIADHMVVQRGMPVHIWGSAAPGEAVSVTFRGATRSTVADRLGRWSVYLPPVAPGGPFEITIQASNTITVKDVLAGDVWVASGQSNMEMPVSGVTNAKAEIAAADYPQIRLFQALNKVSLYPLEDIAAHKWGDSTWTAVSPETIAKFSAVAYFFGRQIHQKEGVPVGLIESNWGGTPAEAWTSLTGLGADASLMPVFAGWGKMMDAQATIELERSLEEKAYQDSVAKAQAEGRQPPEREQRWHPNQDYCWQPAGLFNAMIAPLTRFPIRGAIWYQGESNASPDRAPLYARLFRTMIQDWRRAWGQGDFPFLFVQIANFKTSPDAMWPTVRDAQRRTLELANTGMAVTIDIGEATNIHPLNKQEVGHRLALAGRALSYGERIEYAGPLFRQATPEGAAMRVWFDHISGGLKAKGETVTGFELAGQDGKFVPAEARIDGTTVVVSASAVPEPKFVRYAWKDVPDCNLYNGENLPASPFRSGE
jgi:sialate O-acetylesterase